MLNPGGQYYYVNPDEVDHNSMPTRLLSTARVIRQVGDKYYLIELEEKQFITAASNLYADQIAALKQAYIIVGQKIEAHRRIVFNMIRQQKELNNVYRKLRLAQGLPVDDDDEDKEEVLSEMRDDDDDDY